jgi:hypothetical protein
MWMIGSENNWQQRTVVRASIVARLLGLRLLRLDADVVVVPSPAVLPAFPELVAPPRSGRAGLGDAERLLDRATRTLQS